jgi:hypothetical protein
VTKPAPPNPGDVETLLDADLDTRVFWGPRIDQLQALVLAALDLPPRHPPAGFTGRATVTSDGHIMCNFTTAGDEHHHGAYAGHIDQLAAYLDYLITELQLDPVQTLELQRSLDAFIATSYEARPTKFAPQSH